MSEDERLELVRSASEAHAGLSEIAFRLRRELGAKDPALKEALKAERVAFRLKRELQRLDITGPDPARPPRGASRGPPRRQGDRCRPPAALAGSRRLARTRTRHKRFQRMSIVVVGTSGTGSPLIAQLVRSGVRSDAEATSSFAAARSVGAEEPYRHAESCTTNKPSEFQILSNPLS